MNNDEYTQLVGFLSKEFTKVHEQFAKIDERFTKVDERFSKIDEEFVKVRKEIKQESENNKRYYGVLIEDVRVQIRMVGEGLVGLQEQFERHRIESEQAYKELMSAIKFSHSTLDERVTVLESKRG